MAFPENSYEQRHFYVNKAKTGVRHFCLKGYKTRCTPIKRERIVNPRNGQPPERDRNEIQIRIIWGQILKHLKKRYTPEKRDWYEFWAAHISPYPITVTVFNFSGIKLPLQLQNCFSVQITLETLCHLGQNDYLPKLYSRQIIWGNCMSLMYTKDKV